MLKKYAVTLAVFMIATQLFGQKKEFTIEDVVINSYTSLAPSTLEQLYWIPHTDNYSYITEKGNNIYLMEGSVNYTEDKILLSIIDLNTELEKLSKTQLVLFPTYKWISENTIRFEINSELLSFNVEEKKFVSIMSLLNDAENITSSPDNKSAAFTVDNNLYVVTADNLIEQVTNIDNKEIVSGKSVHRNEFGIDGGIFWSPKNTFLAFYQMDESMVSDYPLIKIGTTPAHVEFTKYPMAGQKSHHVKVGIYNIASKKTVWLKTGEPLDQYLTNVTWDPTEKYIYISHLNRDQNHLRLIQYNASNGEQVKILFEEKDDEFVEPDNNMRFLPKNNEKFLWFSERDGYNHLYLYNTEGKMIKQVTKGNWVITTDQGFDNKGENLFITSTKASPIERHFYKLNIDSGNLTRITIDKGVHESIPNYSGEYFIDKFSSVSIPGIISLLDAKGKTIKAIHESKNPIEDYQLGQQEIFSIEAENGANLYCKITYPAKFDESAKYPAILYVYGGPHSQLIDSSWANGKYEIWFHKMAQLGYFVFSLDNRGTANRGLNFEQATFGQLGTIELEDQMKGIEHLLSKPFIDSSRIGVYGWSYGGFLATSLMLKTKDIFKVGVAGGPVIDWKFYEAMYGERYMDTPQNNPEGYKNASLLNYVENLKGKLLIVQGLQDPTVVIQNSYEFIKKAQMLNRPLDFFPYVGWGHHVRNTEAIHLYEKITNYFVNNL